MELILGNKYIIEYVNDARPIIKVKVIEVTGQTYHLMNMDSAVPFRIKKTKLIEDYNIIEKL